MSTKEQAYKVCKVARRYPASWFWLAACGAFASAMEGNLTVLAIILVGQLWIVAHTVHRMWGPPIWDATARQGGRHGRVDQG